MKILNEQDIISLIKEDKWMMDILRTAESLNLPDSWIGAGFVRSKVWDHLHGYKTRTPLPDIDVIYFDSKETNPEKSEEEHKTKLIKLMPGVLWQVKNQARMYLYHKRKPYKNSKDALSEWSETATCVAVKLKKGKLTLIALYGVGDLASLILRPIPNYKKLFSFDPDAFDRRMKEKKWLQKWPKLKVVS